MNLIGHDTLVLGDRLGSGGQGTVHRVLNKKINGRWPVAYKEYNAAAQGAVDGDALTRMVELIPALSGSTAEWLCTTAAWPAVAVERQGRISGFLMRTVPDEYYFDYRGFDGKAARKLATAEFLLNDDSYAFSIGLSVDERERLRLLADLAAKLSRLHTLGIAVGDLSPKNLLFAAGSGSGPRCFLIDCDAMRVNGRSVLPQAETPDWQIPAGEERGTASSDVYKLALLAVRVFARNQASRDPAVLPVAAEPKLAELARAALHEQGVDRPAAAQWAEYFLSAASSPKLVVTARVGGPSGTPTAATATAAQGRAGKPARTGLLATVRQKIAVAAVAVLAVVVIAVAANSGGHGAANSAAAASTSSYSTPPDTPSNSASSSPAPPDFSTPSEPSATPTSDPRNASTDQTPFTAGALLPSSFTDSDGEHFTWRSTGPESCVTKYQTGTAQNILSQYNCVSQMAGSYTNDTGTILVSLEVMPMADEQTAQQVDNAVMQAVNDGDMHAGDLGSWCPLSGVGSVCDSSYFNAATKWFEFAYEYRYFLNADALWINLSQDRSSSAEEPLQAAAKAAVLAAGPQNYTGS